MIKDKRKKWMIFKSKNETRQIRELKSYATQIMHNANEMLERPQPEYCSPVREPWCDILSFEKLQQRAARFLKGDYHMAFSVLNMII